MTDIITTDKSLEELNKDSEIQYRLFAASNEADRNKMNLVFKEAGIIYPSIEEFTDIFRRQGLEFVIAEPKPDYRAMLVKAGYTIEQDGSEIKVTNTRKPNFLFVVMFEIDKVDYRDILISYANTLEVKKRESRTRETQTKQ